jgi:(2Fe-2S) ferredoxin
MLIRRPGRPRSSVLSLRSWCAVDGGAAEGHRVTWGTWASPAELLRAVDRLEQVARWAEEGTHVPAAGVPRDDERLLLVCTHGKKDVCCAVRGRPVAAALAARWPEQTWECSHTGGDRFAANLLLLPDGAAYGGLDVEAADEVVRAHREGRPVTAYLRGVVGRPRPVQAAVVAAHDQLGPLPWGDVVPTGTAPLGPTEDEVAASLVRMELRDGRVVEVEVREHVRPAARLTCQGGVAKVSQVPVPGTVRVVARV